MISDTIGLFFHGSFSNLIELVFDWSFREYRKIEDEEEKWVNVKRFAAGRQAISAKSLKSKKDLISLDMKNL